ncbi:MAG: helix-turn-helix transcriptional regulator [Clostridia bacterium]|nr:helix-turn-helix transcriptional regulator [Clostridia bacterium]
MEVWLDAQKVGSLIRSKRHKAGMTQEALSGLAVINRTHLSSIERGKRLPILDVLFRLCYALNIDVCDMINEIKQYFSIETL